MIGWRGAVAGREAPSDDSIAPSDESEVRGSPSEEGVGGFYLYISKISIRHLVILDMTSRMTLMRTRTKPYTFLREYSAIWSDLPHNKNYIYTRIQSIRSLIMITAIVYIQLRDYT